MIAGLLVTIPVALTYIVMAFVIGKLDQLMAPVVTWIILHLKLPLPEDFHLPGLGFILICIFIFIIERRKLFKELFINGPVSIFKNSFIMN